MSPAAARVSTVARTEDGARAPEGEGREKLTSPRDKQLVAVVAKARYLSTEQVGRLFFPTRHRRTAEQVLESLAGLGRGALDRPLLRRLLFRSLEGDPADAWTPTAAGYVLTERLLGGVWEAPDLDVSPEFMEHTLHLNEVLVGLLEPTAPRKPLPRCGRAAARVYARADVKGFRWAASDTVRLPWREYDGKRGGRRERVIHPDAVLELVHSQRRCFLECEMGTQTVIPHKGADKPGSTMAKVERYHQYVRRLKDPAAKVTFYASRYPDGFAPEVLFLVRSQARADHVNEALELWRKTCSEQPVAARGITISEAVRELRPSVGLGPPLPRQSAANLVDADSLPGLRPQQAELLQRFFSEAVLALQAARRQVRGLPEPLRAAHRLLEPAYPKDTQAVQALVDELAKGLTTTRGGET